VEAETIAPAIALRQVYARRHPTTDDWSIGWTVENKKAQSLKISSVRLPHGQFKAQEREFELALNLTGGASAEFETLVHCKEPRGLVTENAFVIFYVSWLSASWRIFVRVRVQIDAQLAPQAAVESITTQRVGFSESTA
jgi:hypothetical protein